MPLPAWLLTQSRAARLFYTTAVAGIARGLSANSILRAYSAAGQGIRRTLGLEVVRKVKGIEKRADLWKFVRRGRRMALSNIPTALTPTLRDYSYRVAYEALTLDGRVEKNFLTVSSNEHLVRGADEDIVNDWLATEGDKYGVAEIISVTSHDIRKSPRFG